MPAGIEQPIEQPEEAPASSSALSFVPRDYQSSDLRFVGGARLEHTDFVYTPDDAAFNTLPDGTLARDDFWYYRKESGTKVYFGKHSEMLSQITDVRNYVDTRMRETDPIYIDPEAGEALPFTAAPTDGSDPKVLYKKGREVQFLTAGDVLGTPVEAGGSAVLLRDISEGDVIDWGALNYNSPIASLETPNASYAASGKVLLVQAVNLDGTARQFVVPDEKATADAIIAVRNALQQAMGTLQEDVRVKHEEQAGQIGDLGRIQSLHATTLTEQATTLGQHGSTLDTHQQTLDWLSSIATISAKDKKVVTNGTPSVSAALENQYTAIYGWTWLTKDNDGEYTVAISHQLGQPVQADDGSWTFEATYNGNIPTGLFAVEVRGAVRATIVAAP